VASAHLLSVGRGRDTAKAKDARGQVDVMTLRQERASMKTRPGMLDDDARARAVMPTSQPFTARDRSGLLTAGRHLEARVPARQSARRPIISRRLSGPRSEAEGANRRVYPARELPPQPSVRRATLAARVTGRDARGPDLHPGVTTTTGVAGHAPQSKTARWHDARHRSGHVARGVISARTAVCSASRASK